MSRPRRIADPSSAGPRIAEPESALERDAAALEAQAREMRAEDQRQRQAAAAKATAEAEAARELAERRATTRADLDAVHSEIRFRLGPESATWHGRVRAAIREYERESAPLLERAGVARGSAFRPERVVTDHPLAAMLGWLAVLAGPAPESGAPEGGEE